MSRRRGKERLQPRPSKVEARPLAGDPRFRWSNWESTFIFTALALVASVIFFWQITRDTSFLSGIIGVEYQRLMPPAKGQTRAAGGPTWTTVYEDFKTRLGPAKIAALVKYLLQAGGGK